MPEIRPFKGIRYNTEKIKSFSDVITQPYDQITDEMEREYKKKSPFNFVNLVLTHYADGHDRQKEYSDAQKFVGEWLKDGIFYRDTQPCLYPYFQEFTLDAKKYLRKGFFCTVRLEELGKDGILPHEKTLSKPKEDRLSLTRITKKDFEPVFMLYTDPDNRIMSLIESKCKEPPVIDVNDDRQVNHKLWQISDQTLIKKITHGLEDSIFVIADGHHRYETFFNYANELGDINKEHPALFKMIVLVNIQDAGLVILPTHRLLMNIRDFNVESFIGKAKEFFTIMKTDRHRIAGELGKAQLQTYGFYSPQGTYILKLKSQSIMAELIKDKSKAYQGLDVAILHTLLIEQILGIKPDYVEDHIRYQRGIEETIRRVGSGEFQCSFLMNSTRPEQVKEVAQHKERMPQKSTDFFPKLISGLVFYDVAG